MSGPPPLPLLVYPPWFSGGPGTAPGGGTGPLGSATNPLSQAQAEAVFQDMAGQRHIPFAYAIDGCYARAHEMARLMREQGIECQKVWNYGNLTVTGTPVGDVQWGYHVAPIINVRGNDGKVQEMVIDPSMSDKPVPTEEWRAKQSDPSSVLERSASDIYYRPQGAPEGEGARDDNYESTNETLATYTEQLKAMGVSGK